MFVRRFPSVRPAAPPLFFRERALLFFVSGQHQCAHVQSKIPCSRAAGDRHRSGAAGQRAYPGQQPRVRRKALPDNRLRPRPDRPLGRPKAQRRRHQHRRVQASARAARSTESHPVRAASCPECTARTSVGACSTAHRRRLGIRPHGSPPAPTAAPRPRTGLRRLPQAVSACFCPSCSAIKPL